MGKLVIIYGFTSTTSWSDLCVEIAPEQLRWGAAESSAADLLSSLPYSWDL